MSIFDDIENGFEDLGNAVTGAASTVANEVSNVAVSFGDSAWNYATIVGDGVASAGHVISDGIVTFGSDVATFSVSASGAAFNWVETSAYDVENWTEDAAGIVANFTVEAYEEARDGVIAAWNFIKDLISSTLPELDDPSQIAHDMAYFILNAAALGYEQMAKRAGMTISLSLTPKAGALFNVSYTLGLYVDSDGNWGFMKLTGWDQFKNLSTASLSLSAGISITLDNIFVFGSRRRYSGQRYLNLGAEANFEAFSVGGAIMLESGDLSFLGFKLSASIGLDLKPSGTGDSTKPPSPTFSLSGQSLSVPTLLDQVGSAGPSYDAAVRTAKDPGRGDAICAAALAATMTPFAPRFYGYLRPLAYDGKLLCASGSSVQPATTPSGLCLFRFVAGLADPKGVSIEAIDGSGAPWYVRANATGASIQKYDGTAAFNSDATFNLEQGLADSRSVSVSTRTSPKYYLIVSQVVGGDMVMPSPYLTTAQKDGTVTFARQATLVLDPQPQPLSQTAVIAPGQTLHLGEYRRSPDGRYFMTVTATGTLQIQCGSGPGDVRTAPAYGSPGTGFLTSFTGSPATIPSDPSIAFAVPPRGRPYRYYGADPNDATKRLGELGLYGNPGDLFVAVTDGGRIGVFQGYPDNPGELLASSNYALVAWATKRESVALKGPDGRYVQYAPQDSTGAGYLLWTSNKCSSFETFELATLYDGTVAFRSSGGWYVSARWSPTITSTSLDIISVTVDFETTQQPSAFRIEPQANGKVVVRSMMGGKLWRADSSGRITANGNDGDPQTLFTQISLERNLSAEIGRSFSITAKHSGRRVTVGYNSLAAAAPIIQLGETGGRNQSFTLIQASPGVYSFAAQHSGMLFDVYQGSTAAGAALIQYPQNGGDNQQFRLLPNEDGTHTIIVQRSGLALDVTSASMGDGAAIIQAVPNGSASQRFYIRPEQPLVTRALVAEYTGGWPLRARYQERYGESAWLDGWFDAGDRQLVGDFLGLRRSQLLAMNCSGAGGRVMLADFSGDGGGRALYYEQNGESAWLNGWMDANDWQLAGDFMGRGRTQLMLVNRGGSAGRVVLLELSPQGYTQLYVEQWGQSPLFNGWMDDNDRWLVGDLLGRGHDQVLCMNRTQGGGKVMVVDFSSGTTVVPYWESWGQFPWLNGWFDDPVLHFTGDFLGLGHAQWLMIDPRNMAVQIGDLSTGQPRVLFSATNVTTLAGWVDWGDSQLVGDFLGRGHAQLLVANRQPWSNGKLMIVEFTGSSTVAAGYWEQWGQRTCLDGLLEPTDILCAGDFSGGGRKLSQLLVVAPNVKAQANPQLVPGVGPSAVSEGLDILAHFVGGASDLHFPAEGAAWSGGTALESFTLQLSPPISGLGLEYMASIIGRGATGWTAVGQPCGARGSGQTMESFAVRLTGTYKDQYTVRYSADGHFAADGALAGTTGQSLAVRSIRVTVSPRPIPSRFGVATVGARPGNYSMLQSTVTPGGSLPASPIVLATGQSGPYADTFAVSSSTVSASSFQVNVYRQDIQGYGWGQNLQLAWLSCSTVNQPHFKAGTTDVGTQMSGLLKVISVTFPTAFATVPSVQALARGQNYADTFVVVVRSVTTTGFTATVRRQDATVGWGQDLQLDWIAWDDDAGLRQLGAGQIASGIATIGSQGDTPMKILPVQLGSAVPFVAPPAILLTLLGENYNDAFAVTAANVTASGFTANVCRADGVIGWSQNLRLSWLAIR